MGAICLVKIVVDYYLGWSFYFPATPSRWGVRAGRGGVGEPAGGGAQAPSMLRCSSSQGLPEWPKKRSRGSVAAGRAVAQSIRPAKTNASTTISEQKYRARSGPWTRPTCGVRRTPRLVVSGVMKLRPRARANGFPSCGLREGRQPRRLLGRQRDEPAADPDALAPDVVAEHVLVGVDHLDVERVVRPRLDDGHPAVGPGEDVARVVHPRAADRRVAERDRPRAVGREEDVAGLRGVGLDRESDHVVKGEGRPTDIRSRVGRFRDEARQ